MPYGLTITILGSSNCTFFFHTSLSSMQLYSPFSRLNQDLSSFLPCSNQKRGSLSPSATYPSLFLPCHFIFLTDTHLPPLPCSNEDHCFPHSLQLRPRRKDPHIPPSVVYLTSSTHILSKQLLPFLPSS